MGHKELMTDPHRGAQTISNGMMKTSRQFYLVLNDVNHHKLLDRHLPVQIKRAIYEFFYCRLEVFS
jgi:hypothetical protein